MLLATVRRLWKSYCTLALLYTGPAIAELPKITQPIDLYGNQIQFDVLRNGDKIGQHQVFFRDNGTSLTVYSAVGLRLNFLAVFSILDGAQCDLQVFATI